MIRYEDIIYEQCELSFLSGYLYESEEPSSDKKDNIIVRMFKKIVELCKKTYNWIANKIKTVYRKIVNFVKVKIMRHSAEVEMDYQDWISHDVKLHNLSVRAHKYIRDLVYQYDKIEKYGEDYNKDGELKFSTDEALIEYYETSATEPPVEKGHVVNSTQLLIDLKTLMNSANNLANKMRENEKYATSAWNKYKKKPKNSISQSLIKGLEMYIKAQTRHSVILNRGFREYMEYTKKLLSDMGIDVLKRLKVYIIKLRKLF